MPGLLLSLDFASSHKDADLPHSSMTSSYLHYVFTSVKVLSPWALGLRVLMVLEEDTSLFTP